MASATQCLPIITTDQALIAQLSALLGPAWQVVPVATVGSTSPYLIDLREQIPPDLAAKAEQFPLIGLVVDASGAVAALQAGVHEVLMMAEMQPLCLLRALETAQTRWQIEQARRQQLAEARAQLHALTVRLQNEQIRDPLTGLYSRRYLNETLERELRRADREQVVLSVALIDIDQLEQINWQFGRALGDAVLQHLAELIGRQVRGGDIFCRYGSDEFLLVLPRVTLETILHRAEQWRAAVAQTIIRPGTLDLQVTISIGVAAFPRDARNAAELLTRVGEAIYAAKVAGGNCVRPWPGGVKP
ncbi:GGDEF domain-containing protein [Chloroflexus sp.]|uniref:GGDEF domain-containing protein n=1 Tax=Chloroflexus sp. TaxID=1904827 RepID=UPI00298F37C3|nr:GGDEF domain-containing protein [Chloroflexus sp.]MDW8404449.1 GGDEF domain-containing protein [Chloroflexus sp.]